MTMGPDGDGNTMGLLIERFKSGDPEVVYEKIKVGLVLSLSEVSWLGISVSITARCLRIILRRKPCSHFPMFDS